ncbi:MAG: hypothetical protein HY537_09470, partial [Deltaproteobacteria bacterium]|nr:hypothetical protein [Deltaproteobacteria bacterium]
IIPNIVQVKLLLGQKVGSDLESMGVNVGRQHESVAEIERKVRFPSWTKVIESSRQAFYQLIRGYALSAEGQASAPKDVQWVPASDKWEDSVPLGQWVAFYRAKYRREMQRAAGLIQWWKAEFERLDNEERALANGEKGVGGSLPPVFRVLPDNGSLHQIARLLNRELLSNVAWANVSAHYPKAPPEVKHRIASRTYITGKQFYEMFSNFNYGDPFDPNQLSIGIKARKLMEGTGLYEILKSDPVGMAKWWDQTFGNIHQRKQAIELAINYLLYQFPALTMKVSKDREYWKDYDDSQFAQAMEQFLESAVQELSNLSSLDSSKKILDRVIPNIALMDTVLKYHPDQKLTLCEEYENKAASENRWQWFIDGGSALALVMVPLFWPGSIALAGTMIYISNERVEQKVSVYDHASIFNFASGAQLPFEQFAENPYQLREMELGLQDAVLEHYFLVAQNALAGVGSASRAALQLKRLGAFRYLAKAPTRMRLALGSQNIKAMSELAAPFQKVGSALRTVNARLGLFQKFRWYRSVPIGQRLAFAPNTFEHQMIAVLSGPVEVALRTLAHPPILGRGGALAWQSALFTSAVAPAIGYAYHVHSTAGLRALEKIEATPKYYGHFIEGAYDGTFSLRDAVDFVREGKETSRRYHDELRRITGTDNIPVKIQLIEVLLERLHVEQKNIQGTKADPIFVNDLEWAISFYQQWQNQLKQHTQRSS